MILNDQNKALYSPENGALSARKIAILNNQQFVDSYFQN